MGGGLMQLVAYGAQDVYLTGNPQITFFKVVYRRHTNFAIECIECTFQGNAALGAKSVVPITRNGDLVTKMYLKTTLTATSTGGGDAIGQDSGYGIIDYVELQIGGSKIDRHYGHWLSTWKQLTQSQDLDIAFNTMIGNQAQLVASAPAAATGTATAFFTRELYVPLQFFCNRNDGLALPLIALQYHDVRLEFNFNLVANIIAAGAPTAALANSVLMVDYIYLDSEERKRFAQASHEYLIEQLQYQQETVAVGTNRMRLNFNHPCKELVWVNRTAGTTHLDNAAAVTNAILRLNGHDRFSVQNGPYFTTVQAFQHHSRMPTSTGIHVYSFALAPEQHQPSGTCNFSRIDNAELTTVLPGGIQRCDVYATNYNVLRIMSGMGGLAYSN